MWTAGYKNSWKKMNAAAQDRAGWRPVVCGTTRHKSRKSHINSMKQEFQYSIKLWLINDQMVFN